MKKELTPKVLKHFKKITDNASPARAILQCVYYDEEGSIVATDSHRLLKVRNFHNYDKPFAINLDTAKLVEGNYPDTNRLMFSLDDAQFRIKVDIDDLARAIRAFGSPQYPYLKMNIRNSGIEIASVQSAVTVRMRIEAKVENKKYDLLGFNGKYLLDALMFTKDLIPKLEPKVVDMYLSDSAVRPFILATKNTDYQYMITPTRVWN